MRKTTLPLVLALLLASSLPALADGMFYWPEPVPPQIPYQRALLLFDDGLETLILQSRYRTTGSVTADSLGWVVPVPSVPELASMDAETAAYLFRSLAEGSQPEVTSVSSYLCCGLGVLLPVIAILTLLVCLLSFFVPSLRFVRPYRGWLAISSLVMLFLALLSYTSLVFLTGQPGAREVEVIREEQVGIYDVQVVKATQAGELIEWLNQNSFQFDDTDRQVFDQYLRRGWCFVVARVDPSREADEREVTAEGLVAPLILRFRAEAPIYPLALTSTSGHETTILLYLLSEGKWQDDGRLDLHYAGGDVYFGRDWIRSAVEPEGFFSDEDLALPYLCKFKATLTPEQMREDLTLTLAEDSRTYRKRIITW